jgi:glutathione S-transferase
MPDLEIIGTPVSYYVQVVRIACEEKGAPYVLKPVAPHADEVEAIHPFGRIPVMRHGDFAVGESRAICAYVDRAFPGPPLVPLDAVGAALTEQWLSIIQTMIDPVCIQDYLLAYFLSLAQTGSPDWGRIRITVPKVEAQLATLDRRLGASDYLAGPIFTLADIYLATILNSIKRLPEAGRIIEESPHLAGYLERQTARPSFAATTLSAEQARSMPGPFRRPPDRGLGPN